MMRWRGVGVACALGLLAARPAAAVPLLDGFGGVDGYGTPDHCVAAGNDNSYAAPGASEPTPIDLTPAFPGGLLFYSRRVDHFFLNTNGTITFAAPLATPTATAFPILDQPMIAPWWADVDTRGGGSVCFHLEPNRLVATWHDVGYFDGHADRRNDFQMILSTRPLCDGPGNFDVEFRYHRCEWVSGDGAMLPAQVGLDGGNRMNYAALPLSRTPAIADVCRTSNIPGGEPGLFRISVRVTVLVGCPGGGQPCSIPGLRGPCATGVTVCGPPTGPYCHPLVVPRARGCDGIDNDCDGAPDEGDGLCGAGRTCDRARCLDRCSASGQCPAGMSCTEGGGCIESGCLDVACPPGQRCTAGRCVGLCDGVGCAPGQRCDRGRCIDACAGLECESLTVCDTDPTSSTNGECIPRCECRPCQGSSLCGADGHCAPPRPPPLPDGGVVVDGGVVADVTIEPEAAVDAGAPSDAPRPDVAPSDVASGRLVDAGCGCRAGSPAASVPLCLSALALGASLRRRRRRR